LFSSYSKVKDIRDLAQIIGEDDLSEIDQLYLSFGRAFEEKFITQDSKEFRSIEESLNIGWEILSILPESELDRLSSELIEAHHKA